MELVKLLVDKHPFLLDLQHFEVDAQVYDFARDQCHEALPEDDELRFCSSNLITPISSVLPSSDMTIQVGGVLFIASAKDNEIFVMVCFFDDPFVGVLGSYRPGQSVKVRHGHDRRFTTEGCFNFVWVFSHLISLINQPRLVRRSPNGSRQQRRALHRGMGFAVDAWTRVSWDISKETVAKVSRDPSFHKVPLHWRRGHFRRAAPHFKGAMQRPDAIRPDDRTLWWQWIEGQWVGHPAFGIKKSVHAPRLSSPKMLRGFTSRPLHVLAG